MPSAASAADTAEETDPTTRATYRAVVDAVVPATPELADDLGPEHEPGGLDIGMSEYLLAVTNSIFSMYDAHSSSSRRPSTRRSTSPGRPR